MKKSILCLMAMCALVLTIAPASAAVKVFLLAGQSNMAGVGGYYGYIAPNTAPWTLPPYDHSDVPCPSYLAVQPSVKFWNYNDGIGILPNDTRPHAPTVGNGWINLQKGFGSTSLEFGPELSFGYRLRQLFPNDEIYLVKYAIGGTNLANQWNPYGTADKFNMFEARTRAALANLVAQGKAPEIEGMIWLQGEDDSTVASYAASYALNLKNLIEKVRTDFSAYDGSNMKFVLGRITTMGAYWAPMSTVSTVRDAQINVTNPASSYYVPNTAWFDTDDLQWAFYGHYGTAGQVELGTRFANAFAPSPNPPPSSSSASERSVCWPTGGDGGKRGDGFDPAADPSSQKLRKGETRSRCASAPIQPARVDPGSMETWRPSSSKINPRQAMISHISALVPLSSH
jgi:hypothetical protein